MKKFLIAVTVTAAMQVSVATAATLQNFDFSFTSANPVVGTVTGEIFGLQANTSNQAATDVKIFSFPSGLGLSLTAPIDVFATATIGNNLFQTSGNFIISAAFSATSPQYNLNVFNGANLGLLQNPGPPILNTRGTVSFTLDTTPLPAALPLFASGLGAIGLLGWRRKRKAQAVA